MCGNIRKDCSSTACKLTSTAAAAATDPGLTNEVPNTAGAASSATLSPASPDTVNLHQGDLRDGGNDRQAANPTSLPSDPALDEATTQAPAAGGRHPTPPAPADDPSDEVTVRKGAVDLTQGSLLRGILMLSWPILTGSALNWLMGVADIKMVGSLGPEAIAAVGQSQGIIWTIMAINFAIATGTQVLVARYTGARDYAKVGEVTRQTIIVSVIAGVILIIPGVTLAEWFLCRLGVTGEVLELATAYSQAFFWGGVGLMVNFMVSGALQGAGDSRTPLMMLVWVNILHVIVGYLLIFGIGPFPRLGVAGAAWAVVISRGLATIWMLWVVFSGRYAIVVPWRGPWRIDWKIWSRMFTIGIPSSLQGLTRNVSFLMLMFILNRTEAGFHAITGHTAAGQWGALGIFMGLAMMTAAMTAVGQNMGAENPARAERSCWSVVKVSAIISLVVGGICIVAARPLVGFFTADAESLRWGIWALIILSASLPFATISMAFSGGLRGAGDTYSPMWVTIICTLLIGPVISYYLALTLDWGPIGAFLGLAVSMIAQAFMTGFIFRLGRWKDIVI